MKLESIQTDDRGSISILTGFQNYPEVTIFTTKSGYARGGCIHNIHDEFVCVIEGSIDYYEGNHKFSLNEGQTIMIPRGTPHYFFSKKNSVVLEWGASPEEKKVKHSEMRKIVDDINATKQASEML